MLTFLAQRVLVLVWERRAGFAACFTDHQVDSFLLQRLRIYRNTMSDAAVARHHGSELCAASDSAAAGKESLRIRNTSVVEHQDTIATTQGETPFSKGETDNMGRRYVRTTYHRTLETSTKGSSKFIFRPTRTSVSCAPLVFHRTFVRVQENKPSSTHRAVHDPLASGLQWRRSGPPRRLISPG